MKGYGQVCIASCQNVIVMAPVQDLASFENFPNLPKTKSKGADLGIHDFGY